MTRYLKDFILSMCLNAMQKVILTTILTDTDGGVGEESSVAQWHDSWIVINGLFHTFRGDCCKVRADCGR